MKRLQAQELSGNQGWEPLAAAAMVYEQIVKDSVCHRQVFPASGDSVSHTRVNIAEFEWARGPWQVTNP